MQPHVIDSPALTYRFLSQILSQKAAKKPRNRLLKQRCRCAYDWSRLTCQIFLLLRHFLDASDSLSWIACSSSRQATGCWKQAHLSNTYHYDKHFCGAQMGDISPIAQ